jgi:iodotyrosine deiodinase
MLGLLLTYPGKKGLISHMESFEIEQSQRFLKSMMQRRSIRRFTEKKIPLEALENIVKSAASAPSGANSQPWFFIIVTSPELKAKIREAAEEEEREFYSHRASAEMLKDLSPLETNWNKPHLTEASALIVIFYKKANSANTTRAKSYYPKESVGIATGILIAGLREAGMDSLTHTPSPMAFLKRLFSRPEDEEPFMILAVGERNASYIPPSLAKKGFHEICQVF